MAFSRLVNMRTWDGAPLTTTASHPEQWSWTFTPPNPTRVDMDILGITFDGARLVFSTSKSLTAIIAVPLLVWVDTESQTEVHRVTVSSQSNFRILDIVWDPYDDTVIALIEDEFAGPVFTYSIRRIDPVTGAYKETLVDPLLLPVGGDNVPRAIAWDGTHIFVTSWTQAAFTLAHLTAVDAETGVVYTQIEYGRRGTVSLFTPDFDSPPGIVHNGGEIVLKELGILSGNTRQLTWIEADFGSSVFNKLSLSAAAVAGEENPITFDGMNYYDFDQADPAP